MSARAEYLICLTKTIVAPGDRTVAGPASSPACDPSTAHVRRTPMARAAMAAGQALDHERRQRGRYRLRRKLGADPNYCPCDRAKRGWAIVLPSAFRLSPPGQARTRGASMARKRKGTATDLERFVDADGRDALVAEVRQADRRRGDHLHLLPVPLRHRPDHGQGRPRRALGDDGREGLPARLRRDREPLHRPPRRVHRLRARGRRARRAPRAGDVHAAAVGLEGRARLVHVLPQPRGARGSRARSSRRTAAATSSGSRRSSRPRPGSTCAPAPSPR